MAEFWKNFLDGLIKFGIKAAILAATIIIGIFLVKLVTVILRKILRRTKVDKAAGSFIVSLVKSVMWLIVAFVGGYLMGIPLTALIAIISAATVAIGLALQGSLANLASGIILAVTKPFVEDDFIEVDTVSGKVMDIKLFTTHLVTIDNKKIVIPNSTISSSNIINYTTQDKRMLNLTVTVSYTSDLDKVRQTLLSVVNNTQAILPDPVPMSEVMEYKESGIDFVLRAWTKQEDYWQTYWQVRQRILEEFRQNGIEIPYNKLDVNILQQS